MIEVTTTKTITCKDCGSTACVKFGTYRGVQRYYCKVCKRKFKADGTLFHGHVSNEYVTSALSMYYDGLSLNDIRNHLKQEYGFYPSSSTVYQWIEKYTPITVKQFDNFHPNVGDTWIADETVLRIEGKNIWMYDIIDEDTRYLLATQMTPSRTVYDAEHLLKKASEKAGKFPKTIITDSHNSYHRAIDKTFNGATSHIKSTPFAEVNDTQRIERFHSTLKERTKVMRGLKNIDTAQRFVDGWLVDYNFFRPHMSLDGKTPAEIAGIKYENHSWKQICFLPVSKESEIISHNTPPVKKVHITLPNFGRQRKNAGHYKPRERRSRATIANHPLRWVTPHKAKRGSGITRRSDR